jgi:predicted phage terminase large subunit-like protein
MIALYPRQFCDLAILSEKDPQAVKNPDGSIRADWFCEATAVRVNSLIYLLDLYRAQIPFPEQVRVIKREWQHWHSTLVGIENVAYQWALGQAAFEEGVPMTPVKYVGDKLFRAQLATPHFETGRVRIRGVKDSNGQMIPHPAFKTFFREALDFPYGGNDDTVDAVVGVVLMCTGEEFVTKEFSGGLAPGFSIAVAGGTGRRWSIPGGSQFDVFPSYY